MGHWGDKRVALPCEAYPVVGVGVSGVGGERPANLVWLVCVRTEPRSAWSVILCAANKRVVPLGTAPG